MSQSIFIGEKQNTLREKNVPQKSIENISRIILKKMARGDALVSFYSEKTEIFKVHPFRQKKIN